MSNVYKNVDNHIENESLIVDEMNSNLNQPNNIYVLNVCTQNDKHVNVNTLPLVKSNHEKEDFADEKSPNLNIEVKRIDDNRNDMNISIENIENNVSSKEKETICASKFKIISSNLAGWTVNNHELRQKLLLSCNPDIICVQETHGDKDKELK